MNRFFTLRDLIAANKVELAIQKFMEWAKSDYSDHLNHATMLGHRYALARGNSHSGIISWEERMQEEKSVVANFLELLEVCEREQNELGVESMPGESARGRNQYRAKIKITIAGKISDFPSQRQKLFLLLLGLILNIDFQQISIEKIDDGSIVITLEMPLESAVELQGLFKENAPALQPLLDEFKVLGIPELLPLEELTRKPFLPPRPFPRDTPSGIKKTGAVGKISSMLDFRERLLKSGENEGMKLALRGHKEWLKHRLKHIFRASKLSDDIFEEAVLVAFEKAFDYEKSGKPVSQKEDSFQGFLYITGRNYLLEYLRMDKRIDHSVPEDVFFEQLTDENWPDDRYQELLEAIEKLPERQKALIELSLFSNIDNEDIARLMGYKNKYSMLEARRRVIHVLKDLLKE